MGQEKWTMAKKETVKPSAQTGSGLNQKALS
jgi:hypothetical protein